MKTLAIIGTAGRKRDADRLNRLSWATMQRAANAVIKLESVTQLVSGGAAWADHVAVALCRHESISRTTLFMPGDQSAIDISRYYHGRFSKTLGISSLQDIYDAEYDGHIATVCNGSFFERNLKVAKSADVFIAMTFGHGCRVKDGGTSHTVRAMLSRGISGYHLDLNTFKLHKPAKA